MADPSTQAFFYHRAVAPMMWVLVGLVSIELIVVHLLLAHWSRIAASTLSVLTLGSIAWLIGVVRSFRRLPVLITPDTLVMRVGTLKSATVPLTQVAGLRQTWDGAAVKQRNVLNLALIAYPTVLVELRAPRPGRRAVMALAHRRDDPAAFAAALTRRTGC